VARSLGKGCPDGQTSVARAGFCAALLEASVLRWLYESDSRRPLGQNTCSQRPKVLLEEAEVTIRVTRV
jgi:hypothetical protein